MPLPTLYRAAALAGLLTGVLLLVNDARRVGLLPDTAFTTAIAPVPAVLALFALVGLYAFQRVDVGRLGAAGFAGALAGTAGLLVVEFVTHYVFHGLSDDAIDDLVTTRVRAGFLVIAAVFAVGTLLFAVASWRADRYPRWAVALYAVGFLLAAARGAAPDAVISFGFLIGSVGLLGMAAGLWRTVVPVPV